MALPSDLSFAESLKSERRKAFYETHKGTALVMIILVFLAPLVGVAVNGFHGAVLGLVLSVLGYYVTPYIVLKLRAL